MIVKTIVNYHILIIIQANYVVSCFAEQIISYDSINIAYYLLDRCGIDYA